MEGKQPVVTLADLTRLQAQEAKAAPLTADEVDDYATACLVVLRGMPISDKRKVIARMGRLIARRR